MSPSINRFNDEPVRYDASQIWLALKRDRGFSPQRLTMLSIPQNSSLAGRATNSRGKGRASYASERYLWACVLIVLLVTGVGADVDAVETASPGVGIESATGHEGFNQQWTFDHPQTSWVAGGTCTAMVEGGSLKIHSTGGDPYVVSPKIAVALGNEILRVTLKMKSGSSGFGQCYWSSTDNAMDEDNTDHFSVIHDNQWHEYTVDLSATGTLDALRLDPSTASGDIDVAWIRLSVVSSKERHTAAEWLKTALSETKQQQQWESTHPVDSALLLGAGEFVIGLYGKVPDAKLEIGNQEFLSWWRKEGAEGLREWSAKGFPMMLDRDHLIYSTMALYAAQSTGRTAATIFVDGQPFSNPTAFWAYYDRIKQSGMQVYRKGLSGKALSQAEYNLLRIYAPIPYSMWGAQYLPFAIAGYGQGMTAGVFDQLPSPGMRAPDFTLPRLESILQGPHFTDAYTLDYRRPFHSEIAAFLLYVCSGFEPIPLRERSPGGPVIQAKSQASPCPGCVTLSASRGKKPVLIIFGDGIDADCASCEPLLEPLYQATREKIDWYFICTDIVDNIYSSVYYLPPNHGVQIFQKALSLEERGQTAKMWSMRWPNLTFPMVLDDMQQSTQIAYTDGGGGATSRLIDKNGIVCLNTGIKPMPNQYIYQDYWPVQYRYAFNVRYSCLIAANIKTLLEHQGLWNGKDAILSDWTRSPSFDQVRITHMDITAGQISVSSGTGTDCIISVMPDTRIRFSQSPDLCKSMKDLAVGMTISCVYASDTPGGSKTARFIVQGATINDFISYASYVGMPVWCPAIVTAIHGHDLQVSLVHRPRDEVRGLTYWEQPGATDFNWESQVVKDWMDHPDQSLTFHVDRATDVILDGMQGSFSDIHVGDHLGVEYRPDQKRDTLQPFFIFDYRFNTSPKQ